VEKVEQCADVVLKLFGAEAGLAAQAADALTQGVVEALRSM
jgi:hypothetical protein